MLSNDQIIDALRSCYHAIASESGCAEDCPAYNNHSDCAFLEIEAALRLEELVRDNEQLKKDVAYLTKKIIEGGVE